MMQIFVSSSPKLWRLSVDPSNRSSCGTLQVKSVSGSPWCSTTTATCMPSSSSTMSPTVPVSAAYRHGLRSASSTLWAQRFPGSSWETSVTSKTPSKWVQRWRSSLPTPIPCPFLRRLQRTQIFRRMDLWAEAAVTTWKPFLWQWLTSCDLRNLWC